MSTAATPTLAQVVESLERRYPPRIAEDWDVVGLVCGDPAQPVRKVLFALDATAAVVDEALEWGADLVVTHHPLLFRPVTSVAATTFKGALVHRLVRGGCALFAAHTNADGADDGVCDALATALGVRDTRPLVPATAPEVDKLVVFVPQDHTDAVVAALVAVGAGALGDYEGCTWRTTGVGTFTPLPGAHPAVGEVGRPETVVEDRVELVAPRRERAAVVAALRAAHPYEEPAFDVLETAPTALPQGIGRVGRLDAPVTLEAFARGVARALPATPQGVRVAGDLRALVETVAVVGGAGDSLFDAVRASGADVYVTSDLRHHPAMELRERAEFEAAARGDAPSSGTPYLIDTAHWASESPWLALAAVALERDLADTTPSSASSSVEPKIGTRIETRVSALSTDPWTARFDS